MKMQNITRLVMMQCFQESLRTLPPAAPYLNMTVIERGQMWLKIKDPPNFISHPVPNGMQDVLGCRMLCKKHN